MSVTNIRITHGNEDAFRLTYNSESRELKATHRPSGIEQLVCRSVDRPNRWHVDCDGDRITVETVPSPDDPGSRPHRVAPRPPWRPDVGADDDDTDGDDDA